MAEKLANKAIDVPAHLIDDVVRYQRVLEKAFVEIDTLQTAIRVVQDKNAIARGELIAKLVAGGVLDSVETEFTLDGRYAVSFKRAYVWVYDPMNETPKPYTVRH